MDVPGSIARLKAYVELLDRYDHMQQSYKRGHLYDDILAESQVVQQIVHRLVDPKFNVIPDLRARPLMYTDAARALTIMAISRLESVADVHALVGSKPAPRLSADSLHPWVWGAARTLWETKHYRQAVAQAATSLVAHVETLVGRRDLSDKQLMNEVFSSSPPAEGKPRLVYPGDDDSQTVKSIRDGLRQYAPGVILAIRNPAAHETGEYTEHEALERLAAFSLLARWIEQCEVRTV